MTPADLLLRPGWLPLLLLGPLAWLALRAADRRRAALLAATAGPRAAALAPGAGGGAAARRRLFSGGVLLAAAALLEPAWGEAAGGPAPRGADVVVCLDVSRSMLARDVPPSRLARAKAEVLALAREARGDRLALVAFAGEARLLVPLTRDAGTFAGILETADPLSVAKGGTDLGAALDAALAALDRGGGTAGAIVLVSDGEDLEGRGLRAAERCRARGVPVHAAAVGTLRGGKIAVEGPAGEAFQRDRAGAEVVTAADPAGLRRIAAAAGGGTADAGGAEGALAALHRERILPDSRRAFGEGERPAREPRFPWALFAAFGLWILEPCWTGPRRP